MHLTVASSPEARIIIISKHGILLIMIKSELINRIAAAQQGLSQEDVELSVNQILEFVSETLSKGGRVEIRGFGSFQVRYRPPRNSHNPKTGERLKTPAKYMPAFKTGKELRERINHTAGTRIIPENREPEEDQF